MGSYNIYTYLNINIQMSTKDMSLGERILMIYFHPYTSIGKHTQNHNSVLKK